MTSFAKFQVFCFHNPIEGQPGLLLPLFKDESRGFSSHEPGDLHSTLFTQVINKEARIEAFRELRVGSEISKCKYFGEAKCRSVGENAVYGFLRPNQTTLLFDSQEKLREFARALLDSDKIEDFPFLYLSLATQCGDLDKEVTAVRRCVAALASIDETMARSWLSFGVMSEAARRAAENWDLGAEFTSAEVQIGVTNAVLSRLRSELWLSTNAYTKLEPKGYYWNKEGGTRVVGTIVELPKMSIPFQLPKVLVISEEDELLGTEDQPTGALLRALRAGGTRIIHIDVRRTMDSADIVVQGHPYIHKYLIRGFGFDIFGMAKVVLNELKE